MLISNSLWNTTTRFEVDKILDTKFLLKGTFEKDRKAWRPLTSVETLEKVHLAFHASPTKSVQAVRHYQIPKGTVQGYSESG